MAKKESDKQGKKRGEKREEKPGAKAAKKDAKREKKARVKPKDVKTGRGATPSEVAEGVVSMLRSGTQEKEIWAKWFSRKLVSIEGQMGQAWHGLPAVKSKAEQWYTAHRVHSMEIDGPFVGATGFGVRYAIDVEEVATGTRMKGDELAFYTVRNGKVIQEEFMGRAAAMPSEPARPAKPTT